MKPKFYKKLFFSKLKQSEKKQANRLEHASSII